MSVNRRQFIKAGSLALGSLAVHGLPLQARPAEDKATVYFTPEITTESLLRIYERVCAPLQGRIAIKLHTGEPHGPNILPRDMVRALQARIPKSSIVECNVLYPSPRQTTEGHRETLRTNGWTFCPVDIMDADGEVSLPIPGGRHLKEVAVGKNLLNYDSMLVLTHFKGHVMGGFGGSLKNIAIGCASGKTGKAQLHSDGTNLWAGGPLFMERMVEGGKAITTHFKGHMAYINVLRRMSVDCDCAGTSAAEPTAPDIGILASTGLLAAVCTTAPSSVSAREPGQEIIRCGQQTPIKGSPRFFTGTVRIDPLYAANNAMRSSGGSVTFEPGARSHWHIHPVGQVLIVTAGVGLTQEWGKPIQEIKAGDVVICPAKVKHWHGAAPGSAMTHISICEETEPGKVVEWLEPVTDSQYAGR